MNAQAPIAKRSKASAAPHEAPASGRISAKIRRVIDLVAIEGLTQRAAAERVGVHPVHVSKQLARPHVRALFDERKAQAALEADRLKGIARSLAIEEGLRLMLNAQSEAVRAKMVEFFAGEARGPAVAVQINTAPAMGYQYRKPDNATGADVGQAIEIDGKASPVVKGE